MTKKWIVSCGVAKRFQILECIHFAIPKFKASCLWKNIRKRKML